MQIEGAEHREVAVEDNQDSITGVAGMCRLRAVRAPAQYQRLSHQNRKHQVREVVGVGEEDNDMAEAVRLHTLLT